MKIRKFISLTVCLILFITAISPIAYAAEIAPIDMNSVVIIGGHALYCFSNYEYRYSVYVNTERHSGSFAIAYSKNPDHIYEYTFALDSAETDIGSYAFWYNLVCDCFDQSDSWNIFNRSQIFTVSAASNNALVTLATDPYINDFREWAIEHFGTNEYTGRIEATGYKGPTILHVKEDLKYFVAKESQFTLLEAVSIPVFIVEVLKALATEELKEILLTIADALGFIPKDTEVINYDITVRWNRYVTVKDGSTWLNSTQRYTDFNAYAFPITGSTYVDEASEATHYAPSQAYFDDLYLQIDEGYDYYLTQY